jgi:hypothetical protein
VQCLVMGIAMASNVGGMTSPISSPQNIFAIAVMAEDGAAPSWIEWFAIALPVSFTCNIAIWMLLRFIYKPDQSVSEILPLKASKETITMTQVRSDMNDNVPPVSSSLCATSHNISGAQPHRALSATLRNGTVVFYPCCLLALKGWLRRALGTTCDR